MTLFRWKAIVPLALFLGLVLVFWIFFVDVLVRRAIVWTGEEIVGARVDLRSARVHLFPAGLVLNGLAVADPDEPMKNLVEASDIVAVLEPAPLFRKKVIIDSLAVRGVRFGTPRTVSGALPDRSRTTGFISQQVSRWAEGIRLPSLSLAGLGKAINLPAVSAESLRTLQEARTISRGVDSMRAAWETRFKDLNPGPAIDSARAFAERLKGTNVGALGIAGVRETGTQGRANIAALAQAIERAHALERTVDSGVADLKGDIAALNQTRQADYAYARGLVKLPSLDAQDIAPALFGQLGLQRVKSLLYWVNVAERYVPPGLDPRRHAGPRRLRWSGTTVVFPLRDRDLPVRGKSELDLDFL